MKKYGFTYWFCLLSVIGSMFSIAWCKNSRSIEEEIIEDIESLKDSVVQDSARWDSIIKEYREHESDGKITLLIPTK